MSGQDGAVAERVAFLCEAYGGVMIEDAAYAIPELDYDALTRILELMDDARQYASRFDDEVEIRVEGSSVRWGPGSDAEDTVLSRKLVAAVEEGDGFPPFSVGSNIVASAPSSSIPSILHARPDGVHWWTDFAASGADFWTDTLPHPMLLYAALRVAPPEERPDLFRRLARLDGHYALWVLDNDLAVTVGDGDRLDLAAELSADDVAPLTQHDNASIREQAMELLDDAGGRGRGVTDERGRPGGG